MKKLAGLVLTPLLCLATAYFAFLVAGAAVVADSLPAWAQGESWGWILGTPQRVASDPGLPGAQVYSVGSFYWEPVGYRGPTSFACMLPVERPARLSSCYGDTEGREGRAHTGIDWSTNHEQGHRVWTPFGGTVTFAGWNYYLGWTVVIENDGWQVIFGHLCCGESGVSSAPSGSASFQVQEGDIVSAGDGIGSSGNSGNSTGPHLHFEVRDCRDGESCQVMDPDAALMAGQQAQCPWESLATSEPAHCPR